MLAREMFIILHYFLNILRLNCYSKVVCPKLTLQIFKFSNFMFFQNQYGEHHRTRISIGISMLLVPYYKGRYQCLNLGLVIHKSNKLFTMKTSANFCVIGNENNSIMIRMMYVKIEKTTFSHKWKHKYLTIKACNFITHQSIIIFLMIQFR